MERYGQAAQRFGQAAQTATSADDREGMRRAVTDFRTATYGFDAELRSITFPNEQQTIVNTQLLVATGRLVGDLDQLADLSPATAQRAGQRAQQDIQATVALTQQVLSGLGG
jgi:hypothetical protein